MIKFKVKLTEDEKEKYLNTKKEFELEMCDENEQIIGIIIIRNNKKNVKQKKNDKKKKRKNKIKEFIRKLKISEKEYSMKLSKNRETNEEVNDIKKLVKRYNELEDINRRTIWKWYYLSLDKVLNKK
jgi:hypothetical protein